MARPLLNLLQMLTYQLLFAAVDERAWRHQQLARSLQSGGSVPGGDADFALALQLALEDEAGAGSTPATNNGMHVRTIDAVVS